MGLWFGSSPETDNLIKTEFKDHLDKLSSLDINESRRQFPEPEGTLALIILFDQFTRNIYRNSPKMFSNDALGLQLTKTMLETGQDKYLHPFQKAFVYLASAFFLEELERI